MSNGDENNIGQEHFDELKEEYGIGQQSNFRKSKAKKKELLKQHPPGELLSPKKRLLNGIVSMAIAIFILVSLLTFKFDPAPQLAGQIVSIRQNYVVIEPLENVRLQSNQTLDVLRKDRDFTKNVGKVRLDSLLTTPFLAEILIQKDSLGLQHNDVLQTRRPPWYRLDYQLGCFLYWLLGILAFIIPIFIGMRSILYFRNSFDEYSTKITLTTICLFTAFVLVALLFPTINRLGGILAFGLLTASQSVVGQVGSLVVFATILILTLIFGVTEFHFEEIYKKFRDRKKFKSQESPELNRSNWLRRERPEIEDDDFGFEDAIPESEVEEPKAAIDNKKDKVATKKKSKSSQKKEETPSLKTDLPAEKNEEYVFPTLKILKKSGTVDFAKQKKEMGRKGRILEDKLREFGVEGEVDGVNPGPLITLYEFCPEAGIKISKIVNLADDLAMRMKAHPVRIIAPIPGKEAVGIEIPNESAQTVYMRDILDSREFSTVESKLTIALGMDVAGYPFVADITDMPHLLIAGATGAGKSVCLNAIICSVLFRATPEEVRFLMIDPKRLELSTYNGIPHLVAPVVTQPTEAVTALSWAVTQMEKRYKLLAFAGVRDIDSYNRIARSKKSNDKEKDSLSPLPYLLVIVDELADLMMTSAREIETYFARLAQMARAVGIHLIIATQRPSVDVITGTIKANFPSRIAFQVASKTDSRTILDMNGADQLLGHGDMLFLPAWRGKPFRIHGSYVSTSEVNKIVAHIKDKNSSWHIEQKISFQEIVEQGSALSKWSDKDALYPEALKLVIKEQQASISFLQRKLGVGYARGGRILDLLEEEGIVGPNRGSRGRKIIVDQNYLLDLGILESDILDKKKK